jgi:hypothetical protein
MPRRLCCSGDLPGATGFLCITSELHSYRRPIVLHSHMQDAHEQTRDSWRNVDGLACGVAIYGSSQHLVTRLGYSTGMCCAQVSVNSSGLGDGCLLNHTHLKPSSSVTTAGSKHSPSNAYPGWCSCMLTGTPPICTLATNGCRHGALPWSAQPNPASLPMHIVQAPHRSIVHLWWLFTVRMNVHLWCGTKN